MNYIYICVYLVEYSSLLIPIYDLIDLHIIVNYIENI